MATIQLLLTDDANRSALASIVRDRYSVITDPEFQPADLYLVDDASLPRYQDAIEAHKREQLPIFCPVVLIRRERTPITIDLPEPDPSLNPFLINEVVTAPVGRQTLFRRVGNLLARRRQTTDLQEANERLEQFASTLRHEIRNPLNVLDGYLDVAREDGDEAAFEECQIAIDQMHRLFEDTMVVLKGGDPGIEQEPVDLAAACSDWWEMVSPSGAQVEIETSQRLAADPARLRQLLENLFRNAVEHGGNTVTVTVGALDDGFYVEDDGPGIPESERDAVFEQGYSAGGPGTGLGLAVVQAVANAHGWEIRITEGTTGGTRFEITGVEVV